MNTRAHFLVTILTASSWLFIFRLVRVRQLRVKYSLLWLSVGTVMIVLAASPGLLERVSAWVGIVYAPATLFLAANILLLMTSVHFSWELSRLEERTRLLAEELAILTADRLRNDRD